MKKKGKYYKEAMKHLETINPGLWNEINKNPKEFFHTYDNKSKLTSLYELMITREKAEEEIKNVY